MSTEFEIFNNSKFAHREGKPDKYVCYRTVICHALHKELYIGNNIDSFFDELNLLISENSLNGRPLIAETICLFPFFDGSETGYVMVDKSRGYYPLVFYPDAKTLDAASRLSGLEQAIKDIIENKGNLIKRLNYYKTSIWNDEIQSDLQKNYFHYSD